MSNAFRNNAGRDADAIGFLGYQDKSEKTLATDVYTPSPNNGQMMSIIENNTFEARRGFLLNAPVNWTLLRNNNFSVTKPGNEIIDPGERNKHYIQETLILDDDDAQ
jgi:hypothetical protein